MTVPSKSPAPTDVITLGSAYAVRVLTVAPFSSWLVAPLKNTANTFVPATRTGSPEPSWSQGVDPLELDIGGSPLVKPNVTRSTFPTCWACTEVRVGSATRARRRGRGRRGQQGKAEPEDGERRRQPQWT